VLGTALKKRWVNHPPAIQKRVNIFITLPEFVYLLYLVYPYIDLDIKINFESLHKLFNFTY
jgi:hypothetical protein